ncbi:hypothetical protein K523DRAFT_273534 [Schizophyllum commune Tattone D]|nr:hypothetical protein K523DRAFT_273534 [Schizophyllum commune Tattone D]
MSTRQPYDGESRKLIITLDVGTTFSGASYSILEPGKVAQVSGVNRFPAQENAGGDSKIPSILLYDADGELRAVGAEALQDDLQQLAEEEGWTKAEWFKLRLRPRAVDPEQKLSRLPPLPPTKTIIDVFADFLRYLFDCTKTYIQESHPSGAAFWAPFEDTFELVLTHPNGWEGRQQSLMRLAAVQGGIVPDDDGGRARVSFVTEGEASLNFCLSKGLLDGDLGTEGVIIVDAGGGTIDMSAYACKSMSNDITFVEIAPARCVFQGAIMVKCNAEDYLRGHLKGSRYRDAVEDMIEIFDKKAKHTFKNPRIPVFIKFGTSRDNDPDFDIKSGKLTIRGEDVASFFDPPIIAIAQGVLAQRSHAKHTIKTVFLVGGFAASPYLYSQLCETLGPLGIEVCRPESAMNKAVADGGILHALDHRVTARMARFTYGTDATVVYDDDIEEHVERNNLAYFDPYDYCMRLPGGFHTILLAGTQVTETQEFVSPRFCMNRRLANIQTDFKCDIMRYRGENRDHMFMDTIADGVDKLCEIHVAPSAEQLTIRTSPGGLRYYRWSFDVILLFGLTELTAQLRWYENGVEKRSPACLVYPDEQA